MDKPKIDLLKKKYDLDAASKRKPVLFFGRTIIAVVIVAAVFGGVFSYQVSSTTDSTGNFPELSLFSTIRHFVTSGDRELEGEEDDRVNFLLMGIGGEGHNGPQLTDTIIFASYEPSSGKVGLMSLPRDMSVPIPGYGYRKVNHANAYGEMQDTGEGPLLASQVVGDVLDEEIQYYVRVDFAGFAKLVDDIGGIDVYIEQAFTDPEYPTRGREFDLCGDDEEGERAETAERAEVETESYGFVTDDVGEGEGLVTVAAPDYSCRFEVLTFQEGWTRMDGETALKFVRSRHGTNGEGSDFARSRRQQKVLMAVKDKIFSVSTFLNPAKINRILNTLKEHIATNLDAWELVRLAKEFRNLETSEMVHHVIDASESSPLYATVLNGAYVLLPKNDDWSELRYIAEYIFTERDGSQTEYAGALQGEKPLFVRVEIQNGTNITGLAFRTSQLLDGQGYDVIKIGNAATRGFKHTVIYDLTNGQRSDELKAVQDFLQADVTMSATGWLISGEVVPKELSFTDEDFEELTTEDNVDFLIILGENSANLVRR